MKINLILALIASCAVLFAVQSHGQSVAINTNGVLVIQSTNSTPTTPVIEIAPEIRAQLLQAAADEIGPPEPNDLENLLARHHAVKAKALAIQDRKARSSTNAVNAAALAPAPVTAPGTAPLNAPQTPTIEQLDRVIGQLTEIRSQLSERRPIQLAK